MKMLFLLFALSAISQNGFAQLSKGQWQIGFGSNASFYHVTKGDENGYWSAMNNLMCGYFLTDKFSLGLQSELIISPESDPIRRASLISNSIIPQKQFNIGIYGKKYFGKKERKIRVVGQIVIDYEYDKYNPIFIQSKFRSFNGSIGIGLNKRFNKNLYFESIFEVPLIEYDQVGLSPSSSGRSGPPAIVSAGFYYVFNKSMNSEIFNPLIMKKGKAFTSWVFGRPMLPNTFSANPSFGKFFSDKFVLGFSLPVSLNIKENLRWFSIGSGPLGRYYFHANNQIHFFSEASYTFQFLETFNPLTPARFSNQNFLHEIRAGFGIDYLLNESLAVEFTCHEEFRWLKYDGSINYYPRNLKTLAYGLGFLFFFEKKA